MENKFFKKIVVLVIALLFAGTLFVPSLSGETEKNSELIEIYVSQSSNTIEIEYKINDFQTNPVVINNLEYSKISIGKESNLLLAGKPDIPSICRSIVIPDTAKMKLNIISTSYDEYQNVLIAPSKGDLPRTVNPDEVPYEFGDVYFEDAWFPDDIASLREPYIIRDFRGQVVDIFPIQYNPVTKIMRVYTDIKVEIVTDGDDTVNVIYRNNLPEKLSSNFKSIYNNHFINFGKMERYDPVSEEGNMLVIVYDAFWDTMLPFVEWKNIKGIATEMVKVSEIGDANAIKTYIADYYDDYGLTFVLLAGDAAQVPTIPSTSYTYGASDPSYSYIVGADNYQDLFVGRFSAQNTADLATQVERSIEYEKYPQTGADWYHKGTGVASNQGPGDDGEYDDEHIDNIRLDLLAYTYTEVDQIYDPYATATIVSNALNDGRSIVNYCGHGSPTSWGSSGFSTYDINALVNDNMLPFVCCVACNNGQFDDYDECFGEAWLRATNNGEPAGGIGCFASTQSQSWDPPMDAEDEIVDILIESYTDNIRRTYGALCFEGTMHMMDEYGSSCYDETDSWTVFGDPSLQVRTDTPSEMTVYHPDNVDATTWSLEVEVAGIEGALCALSRDGEFFGSAYTGENGIAVVEIEEPSGTDPLDLMVTAYNKIPYEAEILLNSAPLIPEKPEGSEKFKVRTDMLFTSTTTDADDDQIYYKWSWGDGQESEWLGPFRSGETTSATHSWDRAAHYTIEVKAKDSFGQETDWSESLMVHVEKSRAFDRPFLSKLFEQFPILERILELLIK